MFGTSGNLEYPSSGCESRPAKAKTCDCGSLRITSEVTEHLLACGPEAADRASLGQGYASVQTESISSCSHMNRQNVVIAGEEHGFGDSCGSAVAASQAQCGAITLIQRSGSALNLNIHYHMLVPDGVYLSEVDPPYFRKVPAPSAAELQILVQTISERIGRHLERTGKLVRDEQSSYLALDSEGEGEDALKDLQGHSIQYRIAVGPHKGRLAFKLQTLPPLTGDRAGGTLAMAAGFSLHAGVAAEAHQRNKLERVARYITRPPVAIERLSLTPQGNIRYFLKTQYRDGTTQMPRAVDNSLKKGPPLTLRRPSTRSIHLETPSRDRLDVRGMGFKLTIREGGLSCWGSPR